MYKIKINSTLSILLLLTAITACSDDEITTPSRNNGSSSSSTNTINKETIEANIFVKDVMGTFYLWNEEMPKVSYLSFNDTKEYFDTLTVEQDYFSYISNSEEINDELTTGTVTAIGCHATPHYYDTQSNEVMYIVRHVLKNTPAHKAGMKRGDVFYSINNTTLTDENYTSLWGKGGVYKGVRIDPDTDESEEITIRLIPTLYTEDPATEYTILNNDIAYLHYYTYSKDHNDKLTDIFNYFKENNVKDLILDLRYNTGGYLSAAIHLCSLIAPQENVDAGDEIVWNKYNNILSSFDEYSRKNSASCFKQGITSLDLKRVVILTSNNTYSASEATIIGLMPYMEVTTIGTTTGGKNQSMLVLSPDIFNNEDGSRLYPSSIDNWLIAPIVATFYNHNDMTFETLKGITPNYVIDENDYLLRELGSEKEPLIAAGIEYLTTGTVTTPSSLKSAVKRRELPNTRIIRGAIISYK